MREELATYHHIDVHSDSFAEAMTYLPRPDEFNLGPDQYLEQLVRIKQSVDLPVIASLNGFTSGGWIRYAKLMQDAGANALELNVYYLATNPDETGEEVEQRTLDILKAVKQAVTIPVSIKLSPSSRRWPAWPGGSTRRAPTASSSSTGSTSPTSTSRASRWSRR